MQDAGGELAHANECLHDARKKLGDAKLEAERWRTESVSLRDSCSQLQKQLQERTEALTAASSALEQLQLEVPDSSQEKCSSSFSFREKECHITQTHTSMRFVDHVNIQDCTCN